MFSHRAVFSAALTLVLAAATSNSARAAWPHDPIQNLALAPPGVDQELGDMLTDGAGGAYATWTDKRGGTEDIYIQRVTVAGVIAPGWPAAGLQVCATAGKKLEPQLASDGAGGVYVVWADYRAGLTNGDIFAQHVLANGTLAVGWTSSGLALSSSGVSDRRPRVCADGLGGLFAAWEHDFSGVDTDVYGAHVSSGGALLFTGILDSSTDDSRQLSVAADISGGAYVAYQDSSSVGIRIFAVHVASNGTYIQGPTRISRSPYVTTKKQPHIIADGAGGIYAAWMDNDLNPNFDLAFVRLGSTLSLLPNWYDLGSLTQLGVGTEQDFNLLSDGLGGFFAAWKTAQPSSDLQVVHFSQFATTYVGWPGQVDVPADILFTGGAKVVSDGSGGVLMAGYANNVSTPPQLVAQRLLPNGSPGLRWPYYGAIVSAQLFYTSINAMIVPDGAHGAIVGWSDQRSGIPPASYTVYAQRIDLFGALGNAEPKIVSIKDAPKDNGGFVRLLWNASYLDSDPYYEVGTYWIWRQTPAVAAAQAVRAGARWLGAGTPDAAAAHPGRLFKPSSVAGFAWEYVASQPANASAQYSYLAPTSLDSTGSSNSRTTFMVEARSNSAGFWDSAPDSGYSVDNIPPVAPAPFFGTYATGNATLGWGPNAESDIAGYLLYRGPNSSFTPAPSNFVAQTPGTSYLDAGVPSAWYKLAAIDIHGNVSPYSTLLPTGALDAGGTTNWSLSFAPISPDPAPGSVTFTITTPHDGTASLTIIDAQGRMVRRWSDAVTAGQHQWAWNGDDARGANAAPGLYFARLTFEGRELTRRFVRIR
jgi:FlgD Ig-like domain